MIVGGSSLGSAALGGIPLPPVQTLTGVGIASTAALGTGVLKLKLSGVGIASTAAFGVGKLKLKLSGTGITSLTGNLDLYARFYRGGVDNGTSLGGLTLGTPVAGPLQLSSLLLGDDSPTDWDPAGLNPGGDWTAKIEGTIVAASSGTFSIEVYSAEACYLFIDDVLIVANGVEENGSGPPAYPGSFTGFVTLTAGQHRLRVEYLNYEGLNDSGFGFVQVTLQAGLSVLGAELGNATVKERITGVGIASTASVGTAKVKLKLSAVGIASTASLGIGKLKLKITGVGIGSTASVGTGFVGRIIGGTGIVSTITIGTGKLKLRINGVGRPSTVTMGQGTLSGGAVVTTINFYAWVGGRTITGQVLDHRIRGKVL